MLSDVAIARMADNLHDQLARKLAELQLELENLRPIGRPIFGEERELREES